MLDPVAFSVFGIAVHWYGIVYAFGFLLSYFYVMFFAKHIGIGKEKLENVCFYLMVFSVLGARLFEVIVYNPGFYLSNPLNVFAVWEGGMSIHGGILGGVLTLWFFSRKYKVSLLKLTDLFVVPLALALSFGRLANFVNQELVGKVTSSRLGVVFYMHDDKPRWPVQIFESIKNMVTFEILYFAQTFYKLKSGVVTAWFFILYSFGRFFVDFLREPTVDLGLVSMGQLLCLVYGFFGVWLLVYVKRNEKKFAQ